MIELNNHIINVIDNQEYYNHNIWFTSDTHFGALRTLQMSKRPFDSVEEMDTIMINNWNKLIEKDDYVFHLGDFGDYETIKQLNGKVIIIYGNYETHYKIDPEYLLKLGFYAVHDMFKKPFKHVIQGKIFNMSHCPEFLSYDIGENEYNLFGHVHKLSMVKKIGLNVGVDCHNFMPISIDDAMFYLNGIKNYYDYNVFMQ